VSSPELAALLVAAIDRVLAALQTYRRRQRGLTVREADALEEQYREVTNLALAAGFAEPPPLAEAGLVIHNPLDLSAKPYPNRDAGLEWERKLRSLRTAAEAACAGTTQEPHATEQPTSQAKKPKRSTKRGDARAKIIAGLTAHHEYQEGGCGNLAAIGVRELAGEIGVSPDSVTRFFKKEFGEERGHTGYQAACRNAPYAITGRTVATSGWADRMAAWCRPAW
jgi:hypothetical protein